MITQKAKMIEPRKDFWDDFFSIKTTGELRAFERTLDTGEASDIAFRYYINTWEDVLSKEDSFPFAPTESVALDRSTIKYGKCPVIFEGTNHWASKPYLSKSDIDGKLRAFANRVSVIRKQFPSKRMSLLVVPEKDFLISMYLLRETRFQTIRNALYEFGSGLSALDVDFIFDGPVSGIAAFQTIRNFEYPDTHLLGRNYVSYFERVLRSFGVDWRAVAPSVTFKVADAYGDLNEKFGSAAKRPYSTEFPCIPSSLVTLKAGSTSFEAPLGDTWQRLENAKPLIDETVCILGDSHSSIYDQKRLTHLLASTFRACVFRWNPCGVRADLGSIEEDHILLEISVRFMV